MAMPRHAGMMTGSPMARPPGMPGMMMVPRCAMRFEKCAGGMKIVCTCDDPMACSMMQNLCSMSRAHVLVLLHAQRHDGLLLQP